MGAGYFAKEAFSWLFPRAMLTRGVQSGIAITFDDGPHPRHTMQILDILDSQRTKASFFLIGQEAERYPDLVRAIHARGHQVANHGFSHRDGSKLSYREVVADIAHSHSILEQIVQTSLPRDFRPPYGGINPVALLVLARLGYRCVMWSLDSRDSFIADSVRLTAYVREREIRDGDILLFHEDYSHTLEALPMILDHLASRSFSFCRTYSLFRRTV